MNKKYIGIFAVLSTILLSSCGGNSNGGKTTISFFGWGNETEVFLTQKYVDDFNKSQNEINVKYTSIPSEDYETKIKNALASRRAPDVLIAGDGEIKPWIEMGGLANLDPYLENSTTFDLSDFWEEGQNRYLYNIEKRMNGSGHYYGIMRDLSPTVLFYNKTAFKKVGINCISLSEEECLEEYGIAKGYFEKDGVKYFNNQIPMTWEETLEISKINTNNSECANRNSNASTKYGIYYVNWFSLGWSVGANSIQFVKDESSRIGGRYVFSIDDDKPNYSVMEGQSLLLNNKTYNEGEVIDFDDRVYLTEADKAKCYKLPSSLDAMNYYIDLSISHKVAPKPDFTGSTSSYSLFASGNQCSMIVDSRYAVGIYRSLIKEEGVGSGFDWDCAPCPKALHGRASGHSGSLAYCISQKSKNKDAAFKFIEYINGVSGQTSFAEAGFTIPNTKSLSNSEAFLNGEKPLNSQIFIDAASYQTVGDWGFLPSKEWISPWANKLNGDVLNGKLSFVDAINASRNETQSIIDSYYNGIY